MPYAVLRRYITGQSEAAERRRIDDWASNSQERRAYLAALSRVWNSWQAEYSATDRAATATAWTAMVARLRGTAINADEVEAAPDIMPPAPFSARIDTAGDTTLARRYWIPAAAAAAVLVGAIGLFTVRQQAPPETVHAPQPVRTVATAAGQRAEITLGDGSRVVLGVKSQLRFPVDFGARNREVELEGQAHFIVEHDAAHPFVVRATGARIVDIGTAFVVRAYADQPGVQVVVTDGAVAMGRDAANAPSTVLTRGQLGRLSAEATLPAVEIADISLHTAWLENRLVFKNTPLSEVAAELARWHDVDVNVADRSLASETVTARFTVESLPETLRILAAILNLRAEVNGKTVVLHRRQR